MAEIRVRPATPEDAATLLELICALADYEKLPPPDVEAQARLVEHGFGENPRFRTLLAEVDGRAVGYAIYFDTYSTFLARPTLYLEDLFVLPDARRLGAGRAMLQTLAREAVANGFGRMDWTVLDWNELAQGVYRRIGAETLHEWKLCRLTGEGLIRFAQGETVGPATA